MDRLAPPGQWRWPSRRQARLTVYRCAGLLLTTAQQLRRHRSAPLRSNQQQTDATRTTAFVGKRSVDQRAVTPARDPLTDDLGRIGVQRNRARTTASATSSKGCNVHFLCPQISDTKRVGGRSSSIRSSGSLRDPQAIPARPIPGGLAAVQHRRRLDAQRQNQQPLWPGVLRALTQDAPIPLRWR